MIKIRIVAGRNAGAEREIVEGHWRGIEVDPHLLLPEMVRVGSRWEIDYSRADPDELLEWGIADSAARAIRALYEGRTVEFQGVRYQVSSNDELSRVAGEIEDAIVYSGYSVVVVRDDESGVLIEIREREHPLQ